jgi:hypothetical protein
MVAQHMMIQVILVQERALLLAAGEGKQPELFAIHVQQVRVVDGFVQVIGEMEQIAQAQTIFNMLIPVLIMMRMIQAGFALN